MKTRNIFYAGICFWIVWCGCGVAQSAQAAVLSSNLGPIAGHTFCNAYGCAPLPLGNLPATATGTLYVYYPDLIFSGWCTPPWITAFGDASRTVPVATYNASAAWTSPSTTLSCSLADGAGGNVVVEYDNISLNENLFYGVSANSGDSSRGIQIPYTDASGT